MRAPCAISCGASWLPQAELASLPLLLPVYFAFSAITCVSSLNDACDVTMITPAAAASSLALPVPLFTALPRYVYTLTCNPSSMPGCLVRA